MRGQCLDQRQPAGEQLGTGAGQVRVPDIERAHVAGSRTSREEGRLEQGVALFEHPVVVAADAGETGGPQHQQVIEEAPALGRVAAHQREVLGGEQDGAQQSQHLSGARDGGAVDPGPVGATGVELDLDERAAGGPLDAGPHHRALGPGPHHRRVDGYPVRAQRRDVAQRLDDVGLALAVRPHQRRRSWPELQLERRPGPEVGQRQAGDAHVSRAACRGYRAGRSGWGRPAPRCRRPRRRRPSRPSRPQR